MEGSGSSDITRGQYIALAVALAGCALAALLPSPIGRYAGAMALLVGAAVQMPGVRVDPRAAAPIALFIGTALAAVSPGGGVITGGIVAASLLAYLVIDIGGRRL